MSRAERTAVVRRRLDHLAGVVLFGCLGARINRANRFAYVSFVPDSIREHGLLPSYAHSVASWTYKNARRNGGDLPRLLFLIHNARHIIGEGIPGHFAELGVHKGNSAKILADVAASCHGARQLHLFDTFHGFDARDLRGIDRDVRSLYADTSLAAVQAFVGEPDLCRYYPGYFPDSAADVDPVLRFALVHLDCDLYEPTRAGLEFFYPRLSSGGLFILHDYSSGHWPGVARAVSEFLDKRPERLILLPDKSGTAVFRKT